VRNLSSWNTREVNQGKPVAADAETPPIVLRAATFLAACLFPGSVATELLQSNQHLGNGGLTWVGGTILKQGNVTVSHMHSAGITVDSVVDLALRMEFMNCCHGLLSVLDDSLLKMYSLRKEQAVTILQHVQPILLHIMEKRTVACLNQMDEEFEVGKLLSSELPTFLQLEIIMGIGDIQIEMSPAPEIVGNSPTQQLYGYELYQRLSQVRINW
jgi:hypothetical protein